MKTVARMSSRASPIQSSCIASYVRREFEAGFRRHDDSRRSLGARRSCQGCCRHPILGNAEDVVRQIKQLHDSGIDAILMVLGSYYDDLVRFEREIMPGLRALNVIA